ncbi:hypothetical protein JZ751_017010 [Albula glossodonta]|uniref:Uncharacterized protein n=1 Tax=Albula glossodonta TaxID=121402 RepID=A0A8T2MJ24_9TELE|nr:hypothetical protein JZ751_017010 [Albula glossodonta]
MSEALLPDRTPCIVPRWCDLTAPAYPSAPKQHKEDTPNTRHLRSRYGHSICLLYSWKPLHFAVGASPRNASDCIYRNASVLLTAAALGILRVQAAVVFVSIGEMLPKVGTLLQCPQHTGARLSQNGVHGLLVTVTLHMQHVLSSVDTEWHHRLKQEEVMLTICNKRDPEKWETPADRDLSGIVLWLGYRLLNVERRSMRVPQPRNSTIENPLLTRDSQSSLANENPPLTRVSQSSLANENPPLTRVSQSSLANENPPLRRDSQSSLANENPPLTRVSQSSLANENPPLTRDSQSSLANENPPLTRVSQSSLANENPPLTRDSQSSLANENPPLTRDSQSSLANENPPLTRDSQSSLANENPPLTRDSQSSLANENPPLTRVMQFSQ